jgi:hypothetical protein
VRLGGSRHKKAINHPRETPAPGVEAAPLQRLTVRQNFAESASSFVALAKEKPQDLRRMRFQV